MSRSALTPATPFPMIPPAVRPMRRHRLDIVLAGICLGLLTACAGGGNQGAPAPVITPTAGAPTAGVIFVSRGENTIEDVARHYNIPAADLIAANHLSPPYTLTPGQRLVVPTPRSYTVKPGDTLNGLARAFGMSAAEIARLNGLTPPNYVLRVGQVLQLPGSDAPTAGAGAVAGVGVGTDVAASSRTGVPAAARHSTVETQELGAPGARGNAPSPSVAATALPPVQSGQPTAPVPAAPVAPPSSNSSSGNNSKVGVMAIPLPAAGAAAASAAGTAPVDAAPPTATAEAIVPPAPAPTPAPAPSPAPTDNAIAPRDDGRMQWPVHGQMVSAYGPKEGGLRNDGINIGAPVGTPVVAAEEGTVAYAGNQLRGFGNLVLVHHADGYVTAYAHLDKIQVAKGAKVVRGQRIGTVGATGNVTSPQLHFEVRQNGKVVDPATFLSPSAQ